MLMNDCPAHEQLVLLLAERLGGPEAERVEAHVQGCGRCQEALDALSGGGPTDPGTPALGPEPPSEFLRRLREARPDPDDRPGPADGAAATVLPPGSADAGAAAESWPAVPGYEVLGELGRGGMGVVYRARQVRLGRTVALKVLLAGAHAGEQDLARFRAEAEAVARLQHPNVVQIHEVGEEGGRPYLALEYVEGGSLADKLKGTPLPAREAAGLVETLARAVHAAHERGVVHRDLKPANVLLTSDGTPKVVDFGLAKRLDGATLHTQTGAVLGTPDFMAPEQAEGMPAGPAADVHALGAILYVMLTGRPPFVAENALDTLLRVRLDEPVPPSVLQPKTPRDLATVCLKCLRKDPARRYASALALADDLRRFLEGRPILAKSVGVWERGLKLVKRRPLVSSLVALLVLVGLVGVAGISWQWRRAEGEALKERQAHKLADDKIEESRQRLVRLYGASGARLMDEQDLLGSLPWFAEAFRLDRGDPEREEMHRVRLSAILRQSPRLVQLWVHDAPVHYAAFSPDGSRVVTAGGETAAGEARVWDAVTGEPVTPPLAHDFEVTQASFSPDGLRVVTATKRGVAQVWDAATGAKLGLPMEHLTGHFLQETMAWFSPDGRRIVTTAQHDNTARLWDAATGQPATPPLQHDGIVSHAAFSPDGRRLVTTTRDRSRAVQLWDTANGQLVATLGQGVYALWAQFSPDGGRVLAGGGLWETETGRSLGYLSRDNFTVLHAEFSPDGRRAITASGDELVRVWEVGTQRELIQAIKHPGLVREVSFSPDGQWLLTACDKTVQVWDAATGTPIVPPLVHTSAVSHVAFSPDGRRVLTVSGDHAVRIWQVAFGDLSSPSVPPDNRASYFALSRDGQRALTITTDRSTQATQIEERASGRKVILRKSEKVVLQAEFNDEGRYLLTRERDPQDGELAHVWDATTGKELFPPLKHPGGIQHTAFSPDGRRVVTAGRDNIACVWDARTGAQVVALPPLEQERQVLDFAALSTGGDRLVTVFRQWGETVTVDGKVHPLDQLMARVWDTGGCKPITEPFPLGKGKGGVKAVFSADGRRLVTTGARPRVWDAASGEALTPTLNHSDYAVRHAVFSPDGRLVVTASEDHTARVWDAASGAPVTPGLHHSSPVVYATFSPDSRRVLTGDFSFARVWDAATGQPVTPWLWHFDRTGLQHRASLLAPVFSADGRQVIICGGSGGVRFWDLSPDDRSLDDWDALAQLFSGRKIDATDSLVPLDPAALRAAWQTVRARFPADFASSPEEAAAWHRQQAEAGESVADWFAAEFHWTCLATLQPTEGRWYVRRGGARSLQGKAAEAAADYQKAIELGVNDPDDWLKAAGFLMQAGKTEEAVAACTKALERRPDDWRLWNLRASCHGRLYHWDQAIADWSRAIELCPGESSLWRQRGAANQARGQADKAIGDYSRAIELAPNDAESYRRRGPLYCWNLHLYDKALADLTKAIELEPKSPESDLYARGEVYAQSSQWEKAAADFAAVLSTGNRIWYTEYSQAVVLTQLGDREGYSRLCARELARAPEDSTYFPVVRACVLNPNAVSNPERVVRIAERSLDSAPKDRSRVVDLGAALYRAGKFEAAEQRFGDLKSQDYGGVKGWLFLAMIHYRLGHAEEARKWRDKAAQSMDQREAAEQRPGFDARNKPYWRDRLEQQILQREVETLIPKAAPQGTQPE
jgi:WD40 repeat protein/serine/threonine protein kinase/tetratricopeptide (TPR) repeat protein